MDFDASSTLKKGFAQGWIKGLGMYAPFHETIADAAAAIQKHRCGRPVIGVLPAYFPLELIHAAGGYPVQLWGAAGAGGHADAYLQPYCCSVSRSALESAMRAADTFIQAYVFTSLCDTLINLRELYRRLFAQPILGLFIPMTPNLAERRRLLSEEVSQLLSGLEAISGRRVSGDALRESARRFGHLRFLQRELYRLRRETPGVIRNADFYAVLKAGFFLPVEEYSPLVENLLAELKSVAPSSDRRPRVVLSGMVFDPLDAQALFDTAGVDVVDDDFASGWRSVSKPTLPVDDLVAGIAAHLFSGAPCCCIHDPVRDRHDYLVQKIRNARADGVVFWSVKFCEPDAFDRPQLLARLHQEGIAATTVEMDLPMKSAAALQTRIQAFGEMIGGLEI
jgi:bcr-type benzoyl-CoA reductase subunit C